MGDTNGMRPINWKRVDKALAKKEAGASITPMFICNGFGFTKERDGNFVIGSLGRASGHSARFNLNDMASIIAFLTPNGDTAEGFAAAQRFLATGDSRVPQIPARLNPDRGEPLPDPFGAEYK